MNARGWLALAMLAGTLMGCSRADPSLIATLPEAATPAGESAVTLQVSADPAGQLRYVETTLEAPANQPFTVAFNNPSSQPHNWVLVEPGQEAAVAQATMASGGDPTNVAGVIAGHAPITGGSASIAVPALAPGTYPYICTFPGHYQAGMRGTLSAR